MIFLDFLTLLLADDTTYRMSGTDLNLLFENENAKLMKASTWLKTNKLTLNLKKKKKVHAFLRKR